MFAKTALFCALFAASAQVALAQAVVQPACFIKVFSSFQTESPGHYAADQKTLCCKEAAEFKSRIQSDLCPSGDQAAALSSYKAACEEAGYGSCSNSTSTAASATASASGTASPSGHSNNSAPYPIVYTSTSTYFDKECSCTKTTAVVTSGVAGATGLATGTGASGPFATGAAGSGSSTSSGSGSGPGSGSGSGSGSGAASGSPITPVSPSKTGSGPSFTGAATKNVGSVAAGLLVVAGVAMVL